MQTCPFTHDAQLLASGVRVSVAYPPDTATPGYTAEQQTKVLSHA